ncbi:DUF427 domain-containing protein [Kordiimonas laminariae]|uniref:DUF427 domain-containing protein n=1 Tax=Kordiimonas laminariae TaxID=2917717 RepID=UPI001FF6F89F|nr:DUF427 domain-containing protein [Kordiimonas laminariae]MCK0070900.1 DUF427 domain-containing protein [Kordiimonas laminariae]
MPVKHNNETVNGPGYAKNPDHQVNCENVTIDIKVSAAGVLLSRAQNAILLTETGYSPQYYVPRSAINFDALKEISLSTYCPFKGQARYWAIKDDEEDTPVLWGYDDPYLEVKQLSACAAFYTDRVEFRVTE